jgi:asparagine synthase (glutamine-hydrolysing)
VFLTGWDGDVPLRADVRLHWLDRARRGEWWRLASDAVRYVAQHHVPPPIGLRTLLRRTRESLEPVLQVPAWIDPTFARRHQLSDRLLACSRTPRPPTARAAAYSYYALAIWARLFDSHDPNWTGAPLEARHPLVDIRLVSFLLSLPAVPWCVGKQIFREAVETPLPAEIRRRPKTPLRGDPISARLHQMTSWAGDRRPFAPELDGFVVRSLVPALAGCGSVNAAWLHLRAHGLNYWLASRRTRGLYEESTP